MTGRNDFEVPCLLYRSMCLATEQFGGVIHLRTTLSARVSGTMLQSCHRVYELLELEQSKLSRIQWKQHKMP